MDQASGSGQISRLPARQTLGDLCGCSLVGGATTATWQMTERIIFLPWDARSFKPSFRKGEYTQMRSIRDVGLFGMVTKKSKIVVFRVRRWFFDFTSQHSSSAELFVIRTHFHRNSEGLALSVVLLSLSRKPQTEHHDSDPHRVNAKAVCNSRCPVKLLRNSLTECCSLCAVGPGWQPRCQSKVRRQTADSSYRA